MAQHRVKLGVLLHALWNIDQAQQKLTGSIFSEVQSGGRHSSRDGCANVEQIRISFRACADHRVGEADGIRFAPGDMLTEPGFPLGLVRSAGKGWNRSHTLIREHLAMSLLCPFRRHGPLVPAVFVNSADIERSWNCHSGSISCQSFRKFESGVTLV